MLHLNGPSLTLSMSTWLTAGLVARLNVLVTAVASCRLKAALRRRMAARSSGHLPLPSSIHTTGSQGYRQLDISSEYSSDVV